MPFSALVLAAAIGLQAPVVQKPSTDAISQAYFLFLQGRVFDSRDDMAAAIAAYQQALELLPQAADIHAELAGLYARRGQVDDATREARLALATDAANREAHRVLGLVQASQLDATRTPSQDLIGSTIAHLEQSQTDGIRDLSVMLLLGQLYLRHEQPDKAVVVLRQFLNERPDYPQALLLLAQAYTATGRTAEGRELLDAFRKTQPSTVEDRAAAIDDLEEAGQWRQAAAEWATLIRQAPSVPLYQVRYAVALINGGDLERARQTLVALTTAQPKEIAAWYVLSQVERRLGNDAAAETAAQKILAIDATDARGPLAVAALRFAKKDYRGVVQALEPRLADPGPHDVESGMFSRMAGQASEAWFELGDKKKAVQVLEAAERRAPDDQSLLFSLSSAYGRAKQIDQAERVARTALAKDASDARALNFLGYLLAENGRKLDEAVTLITRALAQDADNPAYLDSLGWAFYKQGKFAAAVEPLAKAAAGAPESSVIQEHLGDLYMQLKRYGEAVTAFDRALSGDGDGTEVPILTKKRDRARELAGTTKKTGKD